MPAEYFDNQNCHENINFALGTVQDNNSNMTANMYRVGGKFLKFLHLLINWSFFCMQNFQKKQ